AKVNLDPYTQYKWKVTANQSDGQQQTTTEATFRTAYTFRMGNTGNFFDGLANELPVHGVVLTYEFEIGTYEVTFDQYDAYCDAETIEPPFDNNWGRGTRPVINVSWEDAVGYCNWLSDVSGLPRAYNETTWELLDEQGAQTTDITQVKGWRLPTEAEWEYSARGGAADITDGVESHDYKFAGGNTMDDVGWYQANSSAQTHPVGEKTPNELGLYDMSGNVWEWCHDMLGDYPAETQTNPIGTTPTAWRAYRGGSWNETDEYTRVPSRMGILPTLSQTYIGFRLARTK
ncbi:MAG TPA: formylglycine-generating enzyme family protein, partial [Thermotogota bacterium]|nr:formylglycine-generating enzyme family protein [Thermotogota bacterium]